MVITFGCNENIDAADRGRDSKKVNFSYVSIIHFVTKLDIWFK
jgi:hypothetical protein